MRTWLGAVVMGSMAFVSGCAHEPPPPAAQPAPASSRPDDGRYPNLVRSWDAIQKAKSEIERAEAVHANHGTLGGHGGMAVQAINAAENEIGEAVRFSEAHRTPGPAAVPTEKPPIVAGTDDSRYPNLGNARVQVEWAIRHVEDAMQSNAPVGGLGGHGQRAVEHLRRANGEILAAERWADTHR